MYRRPKFLEILLEIRRQMALESDYDVDLFVESARKGRAPTNVKASSESQTEFEPSQIKTEILTAGKSRNEVRKG